MADVDDIGSAVSMNELIYSKQQEKGKAPLSLGGVRRILLNGNRRGGLGGTAASHFKVGPPSPT